MTFDDAKVMLTLATFFKYPRIPFSRASNQRGRVDRKESVLPNLGQQIPLTMYIISSAHMQGGAEICGLSQTTKFNFLK